MSAGNVAGGDAPLRWFASVGGRLRGGSIPIFLRELAVEA